MIKSILSSILVVIVKALTQWFKLEKAEEYKSEAEASQEALDSIGDSIGVEDSIEEKQNEVKDSETSSTDSDMLGDADWNE